MKLRQPLLCLITLVVLFSACGATCIGSLFPQPAVLPLPRVLGPPQSLEEAIQTANDNSAQINQLEAEYAQISMPGSPTLRAKLALQRPRRFRMRAELSGITGTEMDLGSNDEMFWMWVKRNDPPAVYFARHDQYISSQTRKLIPVEPQWLISALGVVYFDPADKHQGPYARGKGRFEIRTQSRTPAGETINKVTIIDEKYRWILEQHLYDSRGQLLASALASRHRFYPELGISLPHRVAVNLPLAKMSFQIDVGNYSINRLSADPAQIWSPTQLRGYPLVDITDPRFQAPNQQNSPPPGQSPRGQYAPNRPQRQGGLPRYRGIR